MHLHEALEQLSDEHQTGNDHPDDWASAVDWLIAREKLLQHIRQCWLRGLIVIRGREWSRPGQPWHDKTGTPGPPVEIEAHHDMRFAYEGRKGDLLRLYRRPSEGGGRLGYPDAEWRELAINDDDFTKLRESVFGAPEREFVEQPDQPEDKGGEPVSPTHSVSREQNSEPEAHRGDAIPPQAIEWRPTSKRAAYRGDLSTFMARLGLKTIRNMAKTDIARRYIQEHQARESQSKLGPQLPTPSNRLTRIAKQAEKIRQKMEEEAKRQMPPSVA